MSVIEAPAIDRTTNDQDEEQQDKEAHIVAPASKFYEGLVYGTPVRALCGYTFVPTKAKRSPVCQKCQDILDDAVKRKYGHDHRDD